MLLVRCQAPPHKEGLARLPEKFADRQGVRALLSFVLFSVGAVFEGGDDPCNVPNVNRRSEPFLSHDFSKNLGLLLWRTNGDERLKSAA